MSDAPRDVLRALVTRHGTLLGEDPRRCAALLKDHLRSDEHGREIHVLVAAAQAGVPRELAASPDALTAQRLAARLTDEQGTKEELARWAVGAWAHALGLPAHVAPSAPAPSPAPAPTPSPTPGPAPTPDGRAQAPITWGETLLGWAFLLGMLTVFFGFLGGYAWTHVPEGLERGTHVVTAVLVALGWIASGAALSGVTWAVGRLFDRDWSEAGMAIWVGLSLLSLVRLEKGSLAKEYLGLAYGSLFVTGLTLGVVAGVVMWLVRLFRPDAE